MSLIWIRIKIRLVHYPAVVVFEIVHDELVRSSVGDVRERIPTLGVFDIDHDVGEQRKILYLRRREFIRFCNNERSSVITSYHTALTRKIKSMKKYCNGEYYIRYTVKVCDPVLFVISRYSAK